jgi:6-phosphogluconate dehydrogenase (decarboxylating)
MVSFIIGIMNTETLPTLNQFWKILRSHDWTYQYSDDSRVWRQGSIESSNIHDIVKQGGEEYNKLYEEYSKYAWRQDDSISEPNEPQD